MDSIAAKPIVEAKEFAEKSPPNADLSGSSNMQPNSSSKSAPKDPSIDVPPMVNVVNVDTPEKAAEELTPPGGGSHSTTSEGNPFKATPLIVGSGGGHRLSVTSSIPNASTTTAVPVPSHSLNTSTSSQSTENLQMMSHDALLQRLADAERERDELRKAVSSLNGLTAGPKQSVLTITSSTSTLRDQSFLSQSDKTISGMSTGSKQVSFRDAEEGPETPSMNNSATTPPSLGAHHLASSNSPPQNPNGRGRTLSLSIAGEVVMSASFNPVRPATPEKGKSISPKSPQNMGMLGVKPAMGVNPSFFVNKKAMVPTRNYKLGSIIGTGSYSRVLLGLNYDSGELVAVKVLEFAGTDQTQSWWMPKLESLKTEIDLMKTLSHPNIVQYFFSATDVTASGTHAVNIFMEYVPGGSLYKVVQEFGALPEITVSNYTIQICEALAFIHMKNIVHLDIKTPNILLTAGGSMKLADFGTAILRKNKDLVDRSTMHSKTPKQEALEIENDAQSPNKEAQGMRGTLLYMAPEVIREEPNAFAPPADVWSLGCVVMELLTGESPWAHWGKESSFAVISELAKPDKDITLPNEDSLSTEAVSFLRCCLARKPEDRATAESLIGHPFLEDAGSVVAQRAVSAMSMRSMYSNSGSTYGSIMRSFGSNPIDGNRSSSPHVVASAAPPRQDTEPPGGESSSGITVTEASPTDMEAPNLKRVSTGEPSSFRSHMSESTNASGVHSNGITSSNGMANSGMASSGMAASGLGGCSVLGQTLPPDEVQKRKEQQGASASHSDLKTPLNNPHTPAFVPVNHSQGVWDPMGQSPEKNVEETKSTGGGSDKGPMKSPSKTPDAPASGPSTL